MGAAAGQVWLDVVHANECEPVHGRAPTFDDQSMLGLPRGCPPAIVFIPDLEAYRPRLRAMDASRFPALDDIVTDFTAARFATLAVQSFAQPVWASLHAYHAGLALRPQSKFDQLSSTEFAAGLRRLQRAAASQTEPQAVSERYDVLAFTAQ